MICAAAKDANVDLEDETDFGILNEWRHAVRGGTHSGFTVPIGLRQRE